MSPTGPCFISGPKYWFSFEEQLTSLQRTKPILALDHYADKCIIYDANGFKWRTNGLELTYKKT
jgi:hypothetical protein